MTTQPSTAAGAIDICGKTIAATIRQEVKESISSYLEDQRKHQQQQLPPGLAVILIGTRRDSQTYVNMKKRACEECGIQSFGYALEDTATQESVLDLIHELNQDPQVHGILVQLPLPPHMNEHDVLESIDPAKDVDGLHSQNVAALARTSTHDSSSTNRMDWTDMSTIPFSVPCTPLGCIELLDRSHIPIHGRHVCIIGRSNLVGIPLSFLFLHRNATVTILHSQSRDIQNIASQADILVSAVGKKANLVDESYVKQSGGVAVLDVGINTVEDATTKRGYRLVGDVNYEAVRQVASHITPVPGGVGPMTIAMLLRNTWFAYQRQQQQRQQQQQQPGRE